MTQVIVSLKNDATGLTPRRRAIVASVPLFLALVIACWALRGVSTDNIVDTDGARHAMNGVFLHDLIRDAGFSNPLVYARTYYSRYPALSIPYHPPLFPMFEALFFFAFGVNLLAARLAVAVATAASVYLLYQLVVATHRSRAAAFIATLLFFSLRTSQRVAADVMLEMPALAFTLAALYCLRDFPEKFGLRRAVWFALLAGAAVWTKQNALFLGAVPFVWVALERRWRTLASKNLWISAFLFAGIVAALVAISSVAGSTGNQGWPRAGLASMLHNARYYSRAVAVEFGPIGALLVALSVMDHLIALRKRPTVGVLHLAWTVGMALLLIALPPFDERYLLFVYPALVAMVVFTAMRIGAHVLPRAPRWSLPAAIVAAWFLFSFDVRPPYLRGPAEAAKIVAAKPPGRVLYCGKGNGSFIFSMRRMDPKLQTIIIRGDKLDASVFQPSEFERFARDYGLTGIVLERRPMTRAWDKIDSSPTASMRLVTEIPLSSSDPDLNGKIRIYDFTQPSSQPKSTLTLRMMSGRDVDVTF